MRFKFFPNGDLQHAKLAALLNKKRVDSVNLAVNYYLC